MFSDSKLAELLNGSDRVILIKKPSSKKQAEKVSRGVSALLKKQKLPVYRLLPRQINKPHFLSLFGDQTKWRKGDAKQSRYRLICQGLSRSQQGILQIDDAHTLSGASIQLLSQLTRYVHQEGLGWRVILVANVRSRKVSKLTSIGIDRVYPESPVGADRVTGQQSSGTSTWWLLTAGLLALTAVGAVVFWQSSEREASGSTVELVETIKKQKPISDEPTPSNSIDTELQDYLSALAQREQSFEEDLQRIKAQRGPQQATPSVVKGSSDADPAVADKVAPVASQSAERSAPPPQAARQVKRRPANRALSPEIMAAVNQGNIKQATQLAESRGALIGRGKNGESVLVLSAMSQQAKMLGWLIAQGVPTELVDDYGRTALYYASIQGDSKMISELVSAGANVNARSDLNKTPLMAAVHNGHFGATRLLLSHGAQPDLQDHSGWSALYYAVWSNRDDLAELLKQSGASSDLRDQDGYSLQQIMSLRPKQG